MTDSVFLDLAYRYAKGCDRKDQQLILSCFTKTAELTSPIATQKGHKDIGTIPAILEQMFEATQHRVTNVYVEIEGNTARGETYCNACHLICKEGQRSIEEWAIRYQDEYSLSTNGWQYTRRELIVDWVEARPAMLFGEQF